MLARKLAPASPSPPPGEDVRLVLHGVTYQQYEAVRDALDHIVSLRMTYLDGVLELMSPSRRHELVKKMFGRLIEHYATVKGIPLEGYGSATFRLEAAKRGAEPDECYCRTPMDLDHGMPEVAFEVVISSGGVDKLDVYRGLGVPEVWFWERGYFSIHHLGPNGYEERPRSAIFPEIDLDQLLPFFDFPSQTQAMRAFRDWLLAHP